MMKLYFCFLGLDSIRVRFFLALLEGRRLSELFSEPTSFKLVRVWVTDSFMKAFSFPDCGYCWWCVDGTDHILFLRGEFHSMSCLWSLITLSSSWLMFVVRINCTKERSVYVMIFVFHNQGALTFFHLTKINSFIQLVTIVDHNWHRAFRVCNYLTMKSFVWRRRTSACLHCSAMICCLNFRIWHLLLVKLML